MLILGKNFSTINNKEYMIEKSLEQLKLYPPDTVFTVKAKNFSTGEIKILKDQTAETYPKSLSYLKYLNAAGFNIFLSPAIGKGSVYVLLDDISQAVIDKLNQNGFGPYYFLETSHVNFQAIIKLSDNQIDKNLQTFISRQLTEFYGGDPNSTDISHFFRLAGFANRKEKYLNGGLYPFVKLNIGINKVCSKGKNI